MYLASPLLGAEMQIISAGAAISAPCGDNSSGDQTVEIDRRDTATAGEGAGHPMVGTVL